MKTFSYSIIAIIVFGIVQLFGQSLIQSTFQNDQLHIPHNGIHIGTIFDFHINLFQIAIYELPYSGFLWCVIFPCHNKTSKLCDLSYISLEVYTISVIVPESYRLTCVNFIVSPNYKFFLHSIFFG